MTTDEEFETAIEGDRDDRAASPQGTAAVACRRLLDAGLIGNRSTASASSSQLGLEARLREEDAMGLFSSSRRPAPSSSAERRMPQLPTTLKKEVQGHGFDTEQARHRGRGRQGEAVGPGHDPGGSGEDHPLPWQHLRRGRGRHHRAQGAAASRSHSTMYTVQKGDTLWEIAEKHYGKGKGAKYTEIVKANSPPVKDPGPDPAGLGAAHPAAGLIPRCALSPSRYESASAQGGFL